jgi:putative cardiolipin synthase
MLSRIAAAAERGVKVRLLLDDLTKDWSDRGTALVARSPNIQVRRFNPGRVRKGVIGRTFQMSTQFMTLNRRMHNKQLIVDGRWAIVGGRNIGNPYFGLSTKYNNRDLDMLVAGPVISDMGEDFDEYWNADAAYPGDAMFKDLSEREEEKIWDRFNKEVIADRELLKQTTIPVEPIDWGPWFAGLPTNMVFGTAQCLQDSPEVKGDRGIRLVEQIDALAPEVKHISCIITPYMIPTKEQIASIEKGVKEEGRRIQLLVPSMESNNHTMAHSHYKKYRKKLLRAGAELYEFRGQPSAELRTMSDTDPVKSKFISLHTKAFVLDDHWVLLGSLNVDPRSIKINTEHMMIIDSPELAKQLRADYDWMIDPSNAWQVTLNEKGKLRWTSSAGTKKNQPANSFGQRCKDFFWRLMPVEGQL